MDFGLKVKHSLSNKYAINQWEPFSDRKMVSFHLNNGNEIFFSRDELKKRFKLTQNIEETRDEIKSIIISILVQELNLDSGIDIVELSNNHAVIGGYPLGNYGKEAYVKEIDDNIGTIFFEPIDYISEESNQVESLSVGIDFQLGHFNSVLDEIVAGKVFNISNQFRLLYQGKAICSFLLGLSEIMAIKLEGEMNIEESIGEQIITDPLSLDLTVSLGKIEMKIGDLQDMIVGDFIDIKRLPFPEVTILLKERKIAKGELVYNEHKELAIEIKEVFIK